MNSLKPLLWALVEAWRVRETENLQSLGSTAWFDAKAECASELANLLAESEHEPASDLEAEVKRLRAQYDEFCVALQRLEYYRPDIKEAIALYFTRTPREPNNAQA